MSDRQSGFRRGKLWVAPVLSCLMLATAQARTLWHSVPQDSNLTITARWESNPVPGQFRHFEVRLFTVRGHPQLLDVMIHVRSLHFQSPLLAHAAQSKVWFDMKHYAEARLRCTHFVSTGHDGSYQAVGLLQLKGIRHPVSIHFDLTQSGPRQLELAGDSTVIRTNFDIGTGSWKRSSVIGKRVAVRFRVRLVPGS